MPKNTPDEKKNLAISLLAEGTNIAEVARKVDVCRSTVYNWLDDPRFKIQVSRKTRSHIQSQLTFAVPQIVSSIKVLMEIRDDEMNKPSVRLKASTELIALCERLAESNLVEEVEGLREVVESLDIKTIDQVDGNE